MLMTRQERARIILRRLKKAYPVTGPFLTWTTPLELVVGTMLSAQCTDARVNQVTAELFQKYTSARDYADADLSELEREIYSVGFYRNKAKHLKGIGSVLVEKFKGEVPGKLEDLLLLPGVSYKTAYLVLAKVFGKNIGLAVDTHVFRVAPRLGLTTGKTAEAASSDLGRLFKPKDYLAVNELFITHGRAVCVPRRPRCGECVLADICPTARTYLPLRGK